MIIFTKEEIAFIAFSLGCYAGVSPDPYTAMELSQAIMMKLTQISDDEVLVGGGE